jgi:hypothetical protein
MRLIDLLRASLSPEERFIMEQIADGELPPEVLTNYRETMGKSNAELILLALKGTPPRHLYPLGEPDEDYTLVHCPRCHYEVLTNYARFPQRCAICKNDDVRLMPFEGGNFSHGFRAVNGVCRLCSGDGTDATDI